jgi:hypothetical protein
MRRDGDTVTLGETRYIRLEYGDGRDSQVSGGMQSAVAEECGRRQMYDVGLESAQHAHHSRPWHAERQ